MTAAAKPRTKRQRQKEARPGAIVEAALACFLEDGFEATKIDRVAARAGVAKGTVYLYFDTKEALFRAVVADVAAANVTGIAAAATGLRGSIEQLVLALLARLAETVGTSRVPGIARLILRESDRFPDLARIWLEDVATPLLTAVEGVLADAQRRNEIRAGDVRIQLFSVLGPMMVGMLFGDLMGRLGLPGVDLAALARQHGEIVLHGLLRPDTGPSV